MYCSRRLYKGNSYEICLPLVDSGVTMVRFYTTGSVIVEKEPEIVEDSMCFSFTEEELAVLPDGVLRMEVVTEYETIDTNTPYVIATPGDYSGKTIDDITEEAYQSGYTDGQASCEDCTDYYNSGYTEGEAAQKAKLVSTAITENGTYSREDGFSSVTVEIQQTGYTQQDIDNAYASGYTAGYDSGYTDGEASCHDYSRDYLTLEALESGVINTPSRMQYSKNGGEWLSSPSQVQVSAGDKIRYKGLRNNYSSLFGSITTKCNVYGNIMSVFYGDDFIGKDTLETGTSMYDFFLNSTGLVDASNLVIPITDYSVMDSRPGGMFQGCTSLVSAPELPATTLVRFCYAYMFYNCTSLENAPELPATTLTKGCYVGMFYNCTSLVTAPELPATTLTEGCYEQMFRGCTSLETAPVLSADTLVKECYYEMFSGCTNLNYIECLATDISAMNSTYSWVAGVATAGTFVHPCGVEWTRGISGIPDNWREVDGCTDYESEYLTIKANESGTFYVRKPNVSYSVNGGTWETTTGETQIGLTDGDTVRFKSYHDSGSTIGTFSGNTIFFDVYGNIESMEYGDNFSGETRIWSDCFEGAFHSMFKDCTALNDASNLVLPANTLKDACYQYMFWGCHGIAYAPELPATTLADTCYGQMFSGCFNLSVAPELPATTLIGGCYYGMFSNCKSLREAPELPATTLSGNCYVNMFVGCTSLNYVKCLATVFGNNDTFEWLKSVSQTGTFVRSSGVEWPTGDSGIPTGWTVQDAT